MDDRHTTVQQLRDVLSAFVNERDWRQFHSPKNLSMALAVEAAELMEHFQWVTPEASRGAGGDALKKIAIGEELADILAYALAMANELNIDMAAAFEKKMLKNRQKYPVSEYRGRFGPADGGENSERPLG